MAFQERGRRLLNRGDLVCRATAARSETFRPGEREDVLMRILVVEDEPRMADLLRRALTEEGYSIDVARDGPEAVWAATERSYAAIVLDIMLPGYDGIEVCRRLRDAECWSPIIMLTARDEIPDRVRGLDAGADDYLAKPFSFDELAARIRSLVRRGATPRPRILAVGDLRLDPAKRLAWRGAALLTLTPRELALLELLMRHPGEVLTRTRIIHHVWDPLYDGLSNVVDQYVGYLRRKIDDPRQPSMIETVRGAGYRLVEAPDKGAP